MKEKRHVISVSNESGAALEQEFSERRAGKKFRSLRRGAWIGFLLLFCCLYALPVKAAGMTLEQLQQKYPNGAYWNHYKASGHGDSQCYGACDNPDGYTWSPCQIHGGVAAMGRADCNNFYKYGYSQQCCGFVRKLADDVYGQNCKEWGATGDVNAIKPGDVIYYSNHWVMAIGVSGNTVTFGECNYHAHYTECPCCNCKIKWGRQMSKGELRKREAKIYSAPYTLPTVSGSAPAAPGTVSAAANDMGIGDALNVSWGVALGASSYRVDLRCAANAALNQSKEVFGTGTAFSVSGAGTYQVTVYAKNAYGTSGGKTSGNITVHGNVTVTWQDFDGSSLKTQSVKWGGNASAPGTPAREGYTFQSWSSDGKSVKEDTVITANYQINSYVVTFMDYEGNTVGRPQKVNYGSAAVPPEGIPAKPGYIFTGWNSDEYLCVKKALNIEAVYVWENTNLPIVTEILSAKRNDEGTGYQISVKMSNFPNDFTKGKLVTALKTKNGKMAASETDSVSLPVSGELTKEVFILYSGLATSVEVSLVGVADDDTTGTPKAKSVTASVDVGNEWSDWSGNPAPEGNNILSESRTEYRYKKRKTIRACAKPATPEGYTYSGCKATGTYTGWGAWSGWSRNYCASNVQTNVGTQTMYRYFAFHCSNCGQRDDLSGACSRCGQYTLNWVEDWGTCRGYDYGPGWVKWGNRGRIYWQNTYWYFELDGTSNGIDRSGQVTALFYRYQTRQEYYDYEYWQTDFSGWQGERVAADKDTQVETRTAYRFKTNSVEIPCYNYKRYKYQNLNSGNTVYTYTSVYADSMDFPGEWEYNKSFTQLQKIATVEEGIDLFHGYGDSSWYRADINQEGESTQFETVSSLENGNGTRRTAEGIVEGAGGKYATLLVYKGQNTDPTASQIEYAAQTRLDADGHYEFTFITKEEPTVETGDFIITLGVEGATNYATVGTIEAPKPVYTVEFVDETGAGIGSPVNVVSGGDAEAPQAPEKEGYEFIGWDTGLRNVRENLIVTAQYRKKTYAVVFVNWDNTSVAVKEFTYGDALTADVIPEKAGFTFTEWADKDGNAVTNVTENMVVTASYKEADYTVTFLDWDGEILKQDIVGYGEAAKAPEIGAPADADLCFDGWSSNGEENFVTRNLKISPVSRHVRTAEEPKCSVAEGIYKEAQTVTLTTATEGADIYYYICDPEEAYCASKLLYANAQKYTEPIRVAQSAYLCAYSSKDGMGNSATAYTGITIEGPVSVSKITLSSSQIALDINGKMQLTAQAFPEAASNRQIKWSSSNETVAIVSQTGMVIALAEGTAAIIAEAADGSGNRAVCSVTVKKQKDVPEGGSGQKPAAPSKPDASNKLTVGEKLLDSGGKGIYKVLGTGSQASVEYTAPAKQLKTISVPDTVTIKNKTFYVTAVSANAFKGCKKLRSVTIGKNVKTIGSKAFYGCKSLKTINCKSMKLKKVGKNAFKGIHKKAKIKAPKSKLKAYKKLFKGKGQAKSVKIQK